MPHPLISRVRPGFALAVISLAISLSVPATAGSDGDSVKGGELFKQCAVCHSVGEGAADAVGPNLNHIFGRPAASIEGYGYSDAMQQKGEDGLLWQEESLYTFIAGPMWFVPGTSMGYEGLRREQEVHDLLSWLIRFSPAYKPQSRQSPDAAALAAAILPEMDSGDVEPENPDFTEAFLNNAETISSGGELWAGQCRLCHGNAAYPGKAPKLKPAGYTADFVFTRLTDGFRKMPGWKSTFTLEQRKAIVAYVLSRKFSP